MCNVNIAAMWHLKNYGTNHDSLLCLTWTMRPWTLASSFNFLITLVSCQPEIHDKQVIANPRRSYYSTKKNKTSNANMPRSVNKQLQQTL